ncbi:MAG: tRNA uridine-5-carboxymethylaminomethyl(34) synthesis GTPase MnmE [Candidatus Shikimatogenerans sp. Tduv]|uniref:tRNA modification GTPase MnmE n=1 Tax=Candidatus Shikimatogenerans sp. Tduv TaxID=3158567 RepID=A0AAU7QTH4_9FLAO
MKTIVNLSTPEGIGAISIIRISGNKSFKIIKKIFKYKKKKIIIKHKKIYIGYLIYKKKIIDEVIIYTYIKPKSYTGENLVEISCHGSIYIQKKIIKIIIKLGAKLSLPGEFTYRAFLNKKINLLQADNINNLILSNNKIDYKIFINQLNNKNYFILKKIKKKILNILIYIELQIDFSEENININNKKIYSKIINIIKKLKKFIKNYKIYNKNKKYFKILILGNVNTGKSTLFNKIINKNRSIISNIKGTTRNYITNNILYNNKKITIIDSAGIKKIKNNIDKISINNTYKIINKTNLILFLFTPKTLIKDKKLYKKIYKLSNNKKIIKILNKIDLLKNNKIKKFKKYICISAKKNINLKILKKNIFQYIKNKKNKKIYNKNIIINIKFINYIKKSIFFLKKAKKKIKKKCIYFDIIYINIKNSIKYLNKILGENINKNNILHTIFKNFCIGK